MKYCDKFNKAIKSKTWRDMIEILLEESPRNCTWISIRDYIRSSYSQNQILMINIRLWMFLKSMDLESDESDYLRDAFDPWWYAMDDHINFNDKLEKFIKENGNAIG